MALAPTPSAPHASVAGGVASGVPDLAVRKWLAVRDRGAEGFPTALGLGADPLAVAGHPAARIQAPDEVRLELARGRAVVDRT